MIVAAETGSGKTLIYAVRIAELLLRDTSRTKAGGDEGSRRRRPVAVVLAPTHELCVQVTTVLRALLRDKKFSLVCSGVSAPSAELVAADAIVATPGALSRVSAIKGTLLSLSMA